MSSQPSAFFDAGYYDAEIIYEDGSIESGKMSEFLNRGTAGEAYDWGAINIERLFDLSDNRFNLKQEGEVEKVVYSKDVKKITVEYNGTVFKFEKFNLNVVESELNIIPADHIVWAPYIRKGPISLMGFVCLKKNAKYENTIIYLGREDEDFVTRPLGASIFFPFGGANTDEKITLVLKETFRDCPATLDYIDSISNWDVDKKVLKQGRKRILKELKDKKEEEQNQAVSAFYVEEYSKVYLECIDHYYENCGNY